MSIIQSVGNKKGGGRGKIKSASHCMRSIDYIRREDKAYKITYQNCCDGTVSQIADDFKNVRSMYNQDKGILCHHYYQAFPKEEKITPQQAHDFAVEFSKKAWSDYQVIVSTHIDRDHIHSHFIVNNVNLSTGKKFPDNEKSLNALKNLNDDLCKKHGYSIVGIDYESKKYKGINNATKETAKRKSSWKVELATALKAAVENPQIKNKKDLDKYLKEKGFTANYNRKFITIRKDGEEHCIRLSTLAKEAGDIFKQDNIVKRFKIDHVLIDDELELKQAAAKNRKQEKIVTQSITEEKKYFSNHQPQYNSVKIPIVLKKARENIIISNIETDNSDPKKKKTILACVLKILAALIFARRIPIFHSRYSFEKKKYKKRRPTEKEVQNKSASVGNISYSALKNMPDDNITVKIYAHQLPLLCNQNFFYSTKVNCSTGMASVTVKKHNIQNLARVLGLRRDYYDDIIAQKENRVKYKRIKNSSFPSVSFIVIDKNKLKNLQNSRVWDFVDIAVFENKENPGKFNIAFNPKDKKKIFDVIYPEQKIEIKEVKNAGVINKKLKKRAGEQNVRLCYKIISKEQLQKLSVESGIEFAAFAKPEGKFNIVFMPQDLKQVNETLSADKKQEQRGGVQNAKQKR